MTVFSLDIFDKYNNSWDWVVNVLNTSLTFRGSLENCDFISPFDAFWYYVLLFFYPLSKFLVMKCQKPESDFSTRWLMN